MGKLLQAFNESLQTGFVDKNVLSDILYQPELLVNNKSPRKKVLSLIIEELENCEEFLISVAFVTTCGVATLINTFKNLDDRGVKGKILVSQYLNFTQPEALRRLLKFKNIEKSFVIFSSDILILLIFILLNILKRLLQPSIQKGDKNIAAKIYIRSGGKSGPRPYKSQKGL